MTSRALVSPLFWDMDETRRALRQRMVAAQQTIQHREVAVTPEPLLRDDGRGRHWRSIRVDIGAAVEDPAAEPHTSRKPRIVLDDGAGGTLESTVERGPGASWRVLVPETDRPQSVHMRLPDLDEAATLDFQLEPVRRWSIHLVHHTHLDIGYTDPQDTVLAEHVAYLDDCLDLARATDDWPEAARFRWCVESLWSFQQWARSRPPALVAEFIDRVREGRFELTAMPFNVQTEACSTDELHELLRGAREVARRWGLGFTTAMQTDVPGAVAGLPDALGEVGVRYLSVAHNWAGRSLPHLVGGDALPRLFRWRGPSGHEVLVWVTDTAHGLAYMEGQLLGFDEAYGTVDDLLPAYLASTAAHPYPYPSGLWDQGGLWGWQVAPTTWRRPWAGDVLHLRVQGRFGDNAPPRLLAASIVREWNERWAWPRLRMSRNEDFFVDAESRQREPVPVFEGDWNDWWAEGLGSGAMAMSLHRGAQAELAEAQSMAALADRLGAPPLERSLGPGDAPEHTRAGASEAARATEATAAYEALALFDEHTWGAANPWTDADAGQESGEHQWHWKYAQALRSSEGAARLMRQQRGRLSASLAGSPAAAASFHVFNTASWTRDGIVELFLPESIVPLERAVEVIDARGGEPLPFEERGQRFEAHRTAGRFLDVRVSGVPSLGSVRLDVVERTGTSPPRSSLPLGGAPLTLANEYLAVRVDPARAAVVSIVDQRIGREYVASDAAIGFNGYVYDRYTSAGGFNHQSHKFLSTRRLEFLGGRSLARPAAVLEYSRGPLGDRLVVESAGDGARWIRTTLTLHPGARSLGIVDRISKAATMAKESAYLAFPFDFRQPVVRTEVAGGMVGSGLPSVPGGATHMRAMRRWASLEEDGHIAAWVTVDAPLVQFGQLSLPYTPFPPTLEAEPGTIFSWLHNNMWDTNFPSQQAFEMDFRYRVAVGEAAEVTSGPSLGLRTATDASRPLQAVLCRAADGQPVATTSFLEIPDPHVRLAGLVSPTPGRLLLRLQTFAEEPVEAELRLGVPVESVWRATYLGDVIEPLPVDAGGLVMSLPPAGTAAVLLDLLRA